MAQPLPTDRRDAALLHRRAWLGVLRVVVLTAVLVTAYYLLPFGQSATWVAVTLLVVGLMLLIGLIALQAQLIVRSRFPGLRAIEALAATIPLFLLLFASTYFVMARLTPGNFTAPLTRTDALYFTVTVFSTVGFGDITAKTETARLVVSGQMIADLVILGLGIRIIVGAVTRGQQRQQRQRRDADDAQSG
jgi:hypothetical protein